MRIDDEDEDDDEDIECVFEISVPEGRKPVTVSAAHYRDFATIIGSPTRVGPGERKTIRVRYDYVVVVERER